jgi:hypothetical protein
MEQALPFRYRTTGSRRGEFVPGIYTAVMFVEGGLIKLRKGVRTGTYVCKIADFTTIVFE